MAIALPNSQTWPVATCCTGSGSAFAGVHDKIVCTGIGMAGMWLWLVWWDVESDAYDELWMVWLCFAAMVSVGNNGGHTVCGGCCCRLQG